MMSPTRDPIALFAEWQRQARGDISDEMTLADRARQLSMRPARQFFRWLIGSGDLPEANAAALATADQHGCPSVRMVLVKQADDAGFVFYTNYTSRKSVELGDNPRAALAFHWSFPPRQVRVEGQVERLSPEGSAAYWETRPRGSRLGALASHQSQPIADPGELRSRVARLEATYRGREIPCPDFWGGFRLIPYRIEFWQGRADRLHDRTCYRRERDGDQWQVSFLQP